MIKPGFTNFLNLIFKGFIMKDRLIILLDLNTISWMGIESN